MFFHKITFARRRDASCSQVNSKAYMSQPKVEGRGQIYLQLNNYEIVVNFFHISHNFT